LQIQSQQRRRAAVHKRALYALLAQRKAASMVIQKASRKYLWCLRNQLMLAEFEAEKKRLVAQLQARKPPKQAAASGAPTPASSSSSSSLLQIGIPTEAEVSQVQTDTRNLALQNSEVYCIAATRVQAATRRWLVTARLWRQKTTVLAVPVWTCTHALAVPSSANSTTSAAMMMTFDASVAKETVGTGVFAHRTAVRGLQDTIAVLLVNLRTPRSHTAVLNAATGPGQEAASAASAAAAEAARLLPPWQFRLNMTRENAMLVTAVGVQVVGGAQRLAAGANTTTDDDDGARCTVVVLGKDEAESRAREILMGQRLVQLLEVHPSGDRLLVNNWIDMPYGRPLVDREQPAEISLVLQQKRARQERLLQEKAAVRGVAALQIQALFKWVVAKRRWQQVIDKFVRCRLNPPVVFYESMLPSFMNPTLV
jgi:hypothetical protein